MKINKGKTESTFHRQLKITNSERQYVVNKMAKIDLRVERNDFYKFTPTLSVLEWINTKWPLFLINSMDFRERGFDATESL